LLLKLTHEQWGSDVLAIWEKLVSKETAKDCEQNCSTVIRVHHSDARESIQFCPPTDSDAADEPQKKSNQPFPGRCKVVVFRDGNTTYVLRARYIYYCIDCTYDVPDYVADLLHVNQASSNDSSVKIVCPIEHGHSRDKAKQLFSTLNDEPFLLYPTILKQQESEQDTALIRFDRGFLPSKLFPPQRELTQVIATVSSSGEAIQLIFIFNLQLALNGPDISNFSHVSPAQKTEYIGKFVDAISKKANCGTQ
jgi:hypothetical protein